MKLPNGYGTIYKLSGKRRKPWIARKTIGWEGKKQLVETIGTYPTKAEALQALADYNDNPFDLVMSKMTFSDIYEKWSSTVFDENTNKSTRRNYDAAYKASAVLFDMKISDIKLRHLQDVIDNCPNGYESCKRIRILYNRLYEYCMEHEYIKKNYADFLKVSRPENTEERNPFTSDEISILWDNLSKNEYVQIVLILIYSGVRISELLDLRKSDVHLDEQWFLVRESKTEAGRNRVVPIADKVLPFWKTFCARSQCDYAMSTLDGIKKLTYDNFKKSYWYPLMSQLNMEHTPHETRHTCISQLVMRDVNKTIIKKIVGHKSIMNLTEKVYTHIEIKELLNAINKI